MLIDYLICSEDNTFIHPIFSTCLPPNVRSLQTVLPSNNSFLHILLVPKYAAVTQTPVCDDAHRVLRNRAYNWRKYVPPVGRSRALEMSVTPILGTGKLGIFWAGFCLDLTLFLIYYKLPYETNLCRFLERPSALASPFIYLELPYNIFYSRTRFCSTLFPPPAGTPRIYRRTR